jgi:hypothetical protein
VNRIIPVLFALALFSSCTTDFDLEAEWQSIPVAYGFFSVQDTAHYLRLEKAFLEPGGNAFQIAQIADSIYYDDVLVQVEKVESGEVFTLEEVDAAQEGYFKEEGVFATDPHILYKLSAEAAGFQPGDDVRLLIDRGDGLPIVTADTRIAGIVDSIRTTPSINIAKWLYTQNMRFGWSTDPENKIFDLRLVVKYREFLPDSQEPTLKELEWVVDDAVINDDNDNQIFYEVSGLSFYNYLGQNIPEVDGAVRFLDVVDMYVTGAGDELFEFLRVAQANSGITSAQSIPVYTNLSEGRGIFTSRYQLYRPNIRIVNEARDSLINGIYTKHLNFR